MIRRPPIYTRTDTLFPYTTLFRSECDALAYFASQRIKSAHSEFIALPKRRPTTFRPSLPCDWTTRCQSTGEQVIMSEACGLRASAADKPRAALLRRPRPFSSQIGRAHV